MEITVGDKTIEEEDEAVPYLLEQVNYLESLSGESSQTEGNLVDFLFRGRQTFPWWNEPFV